MSRHLLLPLLAGLCGCDLLHELQSLLDLEPLESAGVSAIWPMDGAMALEGRVDLVVAIDGAIPDIEVIGEGAPDCVVDAPAARMTCPLGSAEAGDLRVRVGDEELRFSAEAPAPAEAWFLSEIDEVRGGADDSTDELLRFMLQDLGLIAVTADGGDRLLVGGGHMTAEGIVAIDETGLTLALPMLDDGGGDFSTVPGAAMLPLDGDGELTLMLVDELTLEMVMGDDGAYFTGTGIVTSVVIDDLASRFGFQDLAAVVVGYDLDTNNDGEADALEVLFEGTAQPVMLRHWTETQADTI